MFLKVTCKNFLMFQNLHACVKFQTNLTSFLELQQLILGPLFSSHSVHSITLLTYDFSTIMTPHSDCSTNPVADITTDVHFYLSHSYSIRVGLIYIDRRYIYIYRIYIRYFRYFQFLSSF